MADQDTPGVTQEEVAQRARPVIAAIVRMDSQDRRVPVTPEAAKTYVAAGWDVRVPRGHHRRESLRQCRTLPLGLLPSRTHGFLNSCMCLLSRE